MFQKKLIAAAILATVTAAPAMAVDLNGGLGNTVTDIASVTKDEVLALSTYQDVITMTLEAGEDLDAAGVIIVEIKGPAEFNPADVKNFLTAGATDYNIAVSNAGQGVGPAVSSLIADVEKVFQTDTDGPTTWLRHELDLNNKRLRIYAANAATTADSFQFNFAAGNQLFKVDPGFSSDVKLAFGALLNASYTADPKQSDPIFSPVPLFSLGYDAICDADEDGETALALVSSGFKELQAAAPNVTINSVTQGCIQITNNTTNQVIQAPQIELAIEGDFTATAPLAGGWTLNQEGTVATAVLDGSGYANVGTIEGGDTEAVNTFVLPFTGDDAIQAGSYKLTASVIDSSATYNLFERSILDIITIERDGMKFDTITTGTTSSNQIYIRDVSKVLPPEGGKIFVTITEYAQHGVNGAGEGTDLVVRKALTTTLPSGGAVTLDPRLVQEDLGVTVTEGRQARFLFEVETNQGEVAIKKQVSGVGVDIQNGTRGVETQKDGNLVDFTL
ncbi:hypothetical protein [Motilimonas sp. KMU-193]|uniref:VapA family S-layer protein n=1 Tax=Motilimonas sp. KMU-193 TaxID=3388668 RepID=UPI00396B0BAD